MRRLHLLIIAGGLALAGGIAVGSWWYKRPTTLRVAVTRDSESAQLIGAIAQNFVKERESLRLRPVLVEDADAAAAALEGEKSDLAVVRSDVRLPVNGQTLVVLHRNPAVVLATPTAKVSQMADLRGRSVGVVRGTTTGIGNRRLFEAVLAQHEILPNETPIVDLPRHQVFEALSSGRVAAVVTVGAITSDATRDVVAAATRASDGRPIFIPINEAKAMAQQNPALEAMELARGTFGGAPPKPTDNLETLGVSVRLMAASTMKDSRAGEVVDLLRSNRLAIERAAPLANQMHAPSTDRGAAIPTHPGAAAYFEREEETFFEKYGDMIYIGAMVLSVLGSAAAALASRISGGEGKHTALLLQRLLDVLRAARAAESLQTLDELERETDEILIGGIAARSMHTLNAQAIGALSLALDQARLAIRERRRQLKATAQAQPAPPKLMPVEARSAM